ncbi:MAG: Bacitracin export ATP-binding protein BceA [Prosthecobacter sp.]|nr:Bacitracin export ATP-binding protein BceA [Prosthecobacter sp.]
MSGIAVSNLQFTYPESPFRLRVKDLRVSEGGTLVLLGPSGAGKTTLLRLMSGLLLPGQGRVSLGGDDLATMPEAARRAFRLEKVGLIFQDFALLDYLTVAENILLPQTFRHSREGRALGRELAERLEVHQHWDKLAGRLSQGERQRVAVARALVHRPRFLFADEPTASLDVGRRETVMNLLLEYTSASGASLVMITHDVELAPRFSSQVRVDEFTS